MDLASFGIALDAFSCAIALIIVGLRVSMAGPRERVRWRRDAYNAMCLSLASYCIGDVVVRVEGELNAFSIAGAFIIVGSTVVFWVALARFMREGKERFTSARVVVLTPALAALAGFIAPRLALTGLILVLGLLLTLIATLPRREQAIEREEAQLTRARADAMLSQIQPHFLHNTLTAIRYLARTDPARAKRMLSDFSAYLHGNMESLTQTGPIPFVDELRHTQKYLELEKLRLADRLNVTYDIRITDFALPALSLQTLAENAVRHGIAKRPEGGTLVISARAQGSRALVEVRDDGVGFDTTQLNGDVREHLGIENTKLRLARMCAGALVMESEPGHGTRAVMRLPRQGGARHGVYGIQEGSGA